MSEIYHGVSILKESVVKMITEEINKSNFATPRDIVERFSKLYKIVGTPYSFYVDSAEFTGTNIRVNGLCRLTIDGIGYHFYTVVTPKFRTVKESIDTVEPTNSQAVRSSDADAVAFHLLSPLALERIAARYAEGSKKYGDYNWTKGFSWGQILNHTQRHINHFLAGDRSEDHLAGAAWGLMTLMHFQDTGTGTDDLKRYVETFEGIMPKKDEDNDA